MEGDPAQDASQFDYPGGTAYYPNRLAGDWIKHLIRTTQPLVEKMTLFWHNHFATGLDKVGNPRLMHLQNQLFRKYALGNFRQLLHEIAMDPAMLIWLDGVENTKQAPNENFAREVMELFALGPGNYTEKDVQEGARAFTGWTLTEIVNPDCVRYRDPFRFDVNTHDYGMKTFLGVTGRLNGHQVIEIILQQPAAPRFLAKKLLRYFVTDDPDDAMVERTARSLLLYDWEIRPVLRSLFESDFFQSDRAPFALIKSPVEYVVGFCKQLSIADPNGDTLAQWTKLMGQELFNPPSVKGWGSGLQWINNFTYLTRYNFVQDRLRQKDSLTTDALIDIARQNDSTRPEEAAGNFAQRLGPLPVFADEINQLSTYLQTDSNLKQTTFTLDSPTSDTKLRGLIQLLAALPQYHRN
jgi:uncharacterized protein (DUF1800 family)